VAKAARLSDHAPDERAPAKPRLAWLRAAIALVTVIIVAGLLHTPLGWPLLSQLRVGCPVQASAGDVERARLQAAHFTRGPHASPTQPALGFVLDETTAMDIAAWAGREHVSCNDTHNGTVVSCKDVPNSAFGRSGEHVDELVLAFSPLTHRLVNISTSRFRLDGATAAAQMTAIVSGLQQQLGKPTREVGQRSSAYLDNAPLRTAVVRYRFSDYQADVTATNLPGRGMVLREHYMSAND
jgi:hypothetical protein